MSKQAKAICTGVKKLQSDIASQQKAHDAQGRNISRMTESVNGLAATASQLQTTAPPATGKARTPRTTPAQPATS